MNTKTKKVGRDAKSGKFVSKNYIVDNPDTTVEQTVSTKKAKK